MLLLTCIASAMVALAAQGQELPADKELITGRLDNGLSYYIRHNSRPKGTADFYIVHDVGAMQEEERQNGLAHFLEHLAFNGTKHYPEKQLLSFLGKEGVRFGYNVNAYTSKSETVYHMDKVPLVRESFVDSVLMVLHDWSGDITCEQRAIDEERGVILEEWRRRSDSKTRVFNMQNRMVYQGSPKGEKAVIGSMDVILNFKPQDILDFYHKWYRPDLQALVIVGDFDAKAMEKKVRAMFSDIPAVKNPAPKREFPVESLQGPVYDNMVDSLANFLSLKVFCRQPFPPAELRNSEEFYRDLYLRQIVSSVISSRMKEQCKSLSCPIKSGVLVTYPVADDFYVSLFTILAKTGEDPATMLDFYADNVNSLVRYGMSEEEFLTERESVYKKMELNRDIDPSVVSNSMLAGRYVADFLNGSGTTFPSDLQQIQRNIMESLTLSEANEYVNKVLRDSEKIISYYVNNDKLSTIPSTEEIKARLAAADARDAGNLALSVDKVDMNVDAVPGKVLSVRNSQKTGTEVWKLGNGATVYWTPAAAVKTAVNLSMIMYFETGSAAIPKDSIGVYKLAEEFLAQNLGYRGAAKGQLEKDTRNMGVVLMPRFSSRQATLTMSAPVTRLEQAFKNVYLTLSEPYFGKESELLIFKQSKKEYLSREKRPAQLFNADYSNLCYGGHPWLKEVETGDADALRMHNVKEVFSREFGDIANASIFICSDAPKEEIQDLVEKYIASIKADYPYKKAKLRPVLPVYKGSNELLRTYKAEQEAKSRISYELTALIKPSLASKAALDVIDYVLSARYLAKIREERGGTYSVSFKSSVNALNKGVTESAVTFQTRPEMVRMLTEDTKEIFRNFCAQGPTAAELAEASAYLRKAYSENLDRMSQAVVLRNRDVVEVLHDKNPDGDYVAALDRLTPGQVRKIARKLDSGNKLLTVFTEE